MLLPERRPVLVEDALGKRNERFTVALAGIQHGDQAFFMNTKNGFAHKLVLALEKRRWPSSPPAPHNLPLVSTQSNLINILSSCAGRARPALGYMPGEG